MIKLLFLNILLLILKIIGIIILAVLLLVIGLLSIVLFVPIHYESQYEYYENLNGFCNVNWLFKTFAFNLKTVDGETDYDIMKNKNQTMRLFKKLKIIRMSILMILQ